MAVAAAEATVGLAIVIAIYRNKKTPLVDEYDAMRQMRRSRRSSPLLARPAARPASPITALIGRRLGKQAHWIPVLAIFVGRGSSRWSRCSTCCRALHRAPSRSSDARLRRSRSSTWIPAGDFHVDVGFFVDQLTACLLIVVTTIGLLVHVYSIGYMSHDPGYWRFFAYLNLFMFSMLLLVLADSWLRRVRGLGAGRPVELPAHRLLVSASARPRWPPRRRSSSTASATSGSRSGSWPSSSTPARSTSASRSTRC